MQKCNICNKNIINGKGCPEILKCLHSNINNRTITGDYFESKENNSRSCINCGRKNKRVMCLNQKIKVCDIWIADNNNPRRDICQQKKR